MAALDAGDASEAVRGYVERLPAGLVEAIRGAAETHRWAPCSVCGEAILIERPAKPSSDPWKMSTRPGSPCRLTSALTAETDAEGRLKAKHCPGRHYPLELPWGAWHPLSPFYGEHGLAPW